MVWVLHDGADARCSKTYKTYNYTINLGGYNRNRGGHCGSIWGCGGNVWTALGTGIGLSLGAKLFGGITSWLRGGSFLDGFIGQQNYGQQYSPYWAQGGVPGGYQGAYQGVYQSGVCTCGCNGNKSGGWRSTLANIFGEYSVKPGTAKPEPPKPDAAGDPAGKVKDPNGGKVEGQDPKPESAIDKFKKDPVNNIPELTAKNVDDILKLIKDGTITLDDNLKNALKAKLEPEVKDLKKTNGNYNFTLDFDKLKKLELLCKVAPNTIVDVAYNSTLATRGNGWQPWKHGRLENVEKTTDGRIKLTINNSNIPNEFGLRYDFEQVAANGDEFKQNIIKDGDTKKTTDYRVNQDVAKTKKYKFGNGQLNTTGEADVRSK